MSPEAVAVDWASRVGQVTHALVRDLAGHARDLDPYELGERALRLAREMVSDGHVPRAPAARTRAVGLALSYLRDVVPGGDWVLLGTEMPLTSSRIDLAWEHPRYGVLLDEIKTYRGRGTTALVAADLVQAGCHVTGGLDRFGERLLGLRVLTLGGLQGSVAFGPDGRPAALTGSGLAPNELLGGRR